MARGKRQETLRDFPVIKSIAATLGNLTQGPGKIGIAEDFSHFGRTVGNQKSFGGGFIVAKQIDFIREVERDPFGNRESVLGNLNRGGQEFVEFLFPESIDQLLPAIDGAGNGGGFDAVFWHRAQTFSMKALNRLSGGGPAAGVQAVVFSTFSVVNDGEQIAPYAVPHWRDDGHHRVGGDGRVDSVSAALQDGGACLRCEG